MTKTLGNDAEENDDNLSKSRRAKTRGAKSPEDYFVFNEQTKTIVGYSSDVNAPKAIKILATINGINVEHISTNAFAGQQLTGLSFELPSNLKSIGSKAFLQNPSLKGDVIIPEGVTTIGDAAFSGCSSITSVTIPEGVTDIETGSFATCSSLTNITLPSSLTRIGNNSFYGCKTLTNIQIPNNVKEIGSYAFANCSSIKNIEIPSGVTKINSSTFHFCTSLESVKIPSGIIEIGNEAFLRCESLESINLPESLETIYPNAFRGCISLTSMFVPSNVTKILPSAFYDCPNLKEIKIPSKNRGEISGEPWDAYNATVYWKDTKVLDDFLIDITKGEIVKYIGNKTDVTIPSSFNIDGKIYKINKINDNAFYGNKQIEKITIEKGITSIGNSTFYECRSLKNIEIPDGMLDIGEKAFTRCNSLNNVMLPNSVKSIGAQAFEECRSLVSIKLPNTLKAIEYRTFNHCDSLVDISIPASVSYMGSQVFENCKSLVSIMLTSNIKVVSYRAFADCVSLTNISMQNGLEIIEEGAFVGCTSITRIYIPNSVKRIKARAFEKCEKLKTINISQNVSDLYRDCFLDSGIETIYVDQNRATSPIAKEQPWGASNTTKVYYKGEFVSIDTSTEKVKGEYARNIKIEAYIDKQKIVSKIVMPDGKIVNVGNPTWTGEFKASKNGKYVFKGYDDSGNEAEKVVTIDDIGKPIVSAENATIDYEPKKITKTELYKLLKASAIDELDVDVPITVTDADLEKVKKIKNGETVEVTVKATHPKFNVSDSKKVSVTLNLPDVIPGSQEKPAGYVTVTFAKGEHGKLEGELSQHVNPTKVTDLKTLAPKVTADTGFKHTGWNSELKKKFTEDTTITATYEALPDTVPGSQEKPEGYVTVTFAKGEHGKLEGELSQHVNPTKITDLKTLAPKVKADIGFKHTGWDKALKAKFDKDTTVTATYEALPDTVPGSQEKPEGYVTVTFAKGEHGSLSGETSQHVNPTKVVDLKTLAPKVTADTGFKHTGWSSELKKKFTEDTTITATYEALPDVIPGSQEKPEGYVTVTFAKGEHGSLTGEMSQHVNPGKEVDLKAVAPKVTADVGFKHTGWNSELKKKFTEDTTITATYKAATEKFAITIDPDGGNWNGSTDPIVYNAKIGEYITLPDAPTKEGYTFKYWKGSKYMPGDRYKVEGEHKFTAVWEKKDTSKTDDSSTGTTGTSGTAGANGANTNKTSTSNHAPFTADSQNIMLYLMMSIFSFVLILRLRSQEN